MLLNFMGLALGIIPAATPPLHRIRPQGWVGGRLRFVWLLLMLGASVCASAEESQPPSAPSAGTTAGAGSVYGVVTSDDGSVYEGVHVMLELQGDVDPPPMTQETNSSGAFDFSGVPAGPFKLTVSSGGFVTQQISGVLQAGGVFDTRAIVLPVAASASVVQVSAGSQAEIAQEQLNLEEQQRVLGFFPNYYVSYDKKAVPLTARQKYQLAWRTSIDPVTWVMTAGVAGMEQASNTLVGYGQGAQGYAKRFGANYADTFVGTMLTGAVLPVAFKQDPRYFYKGTGSAMSRAMYAIANSVICKGDNGHWQPNYSGIIGGLAAGGISNLYYPASSKSGVQVTFTNAALGTAEGALQNLLQEFVVRRLTPRVPHYDTDTSLP
jgi:Carboxypeptidase regulatory-like domain